jgi:hypothetical protein
VSDTAKPKRKVGRPPIEIDWEEFDKLLLIHATLREVAGWFNCSEDTIERLVLKKFGMNFADYKDQKGAKGKISIRRKQFQTAMDGNIAMLIWLGKNWLGQSDSKDDKTSDNEDDNFFKLSYRE